MTYVRCINNQGYEASLIKGAIYKALPYDGDHASLRVIDNEGEDYLYDASRFESVELNCTHHDATETVTVHLDSLLKLIQPIFVHPAGLFWALLFGAIVLKCLLL